MLSFLAVFSMLSNRDKNPEPMPNNDILPSTFGMELTTFEPQLHHPLPRPMVYNRSIQQIRSWMLPPRRVPVARISRELPNHRRRFAGTTKLCPRTWHPGLPPAPPLLDNRAYIILNNHRHPYRRPPVIVLADQAPTTQEGFQLEVD